MSRSLNASAANAEPEWEMNVTGPCRRWSGVGKPVARNRVVSWQNPMPLPPHIGIAGVAHDRRQPLGQRRQTGLGRLVLVQR